MGSVRAYVEEGTDILDKGWGGGRERKRVILILRCSLEFLFYIGA